jgi:hypothetical protein
MLGMRGNCIEKTININSRGYLMHRSDEVGGQAKHSAAQSRSQSCCESKSQAYPVLKFGR